MFALIATTHDGSTVEFTDPETIQVVNRVKGCMGEGVFALVFLGTDSLIMWLGVTWIDWHPQGELLALSHRDKFAAILDKRKDDIVQQFANVHTGKYDFYQRKFYFLFGNNKSQITSVRLNGVLAENIWLLHQMIQA